MADSPSLSSMTMPQLSGPRTTVTAKEEGRLKVSMSKSKPFRMPKVPKLKAPKKAKNSRIRKMVLKAAKK